MVKYDFESSVKMNNKEEVLHALEEFSRKPSDKVPTLLNEYLNSIAITGETLFPWPKLKPLFIAKLEQVMTEFFELCPTDNEMLCPNVENVKFGEMRQRLLDYVNLFNGAPFTIQRLCELLTNPRKHYRRTDKFLRGIEKNVMVVSTVDPFGRKVVSENKSMVNGLESNGHQNSAGVAPDNQRSGANNGSLSSWFINSSAPSWSSSPSSHAADSAECESSGRDHDNNITEATEADGDSSTSSESESSLSSENEENMDTSELVAELTEPGGACHKDGAEPMVSEDVSSVSAAAEMCADDMKDSCISSTDYGDLMTDCDSLSSSITTSTPLTSTVDSTTNAQSTTVLPTDQQSSRVDASEPHTDSTLPSTPQSSEDSTTASPDVATVSGDDSTAASVAAETVTSSQEDSDKNDSSTVDQQVGSAPSESSELGDREDKSSEVSSSEQEAGHSSDQRTTDAETDRQTDRVTDSEALPEVQESGECGVPQAEETPSCAQTAESSQRDQSHTDDNQGHAEVSEGSSSAETAQSDSSTGDQVKGHHEETSTTSAAESSQSESEAAVTPASHAEAASTVVSSVSADSVLPLEGATSSASRTECSDDTVTDSEITAAAACEASSSAASVADCDSGNDHQMAAQETADTESNQGQKNDQSNSEEEPMNTS